MNKLCDFPEELNFRCIVNISKHPSQQKLVYLMRHIVPVAEFFIIQQLRIVVILPSQMRVEKQKMQLLCEASINENQK